MTKPTAAIAALASGWGMLGFYLLIGFAIYRLALATLPAFNYTFSAIHWLVMLANIIFMAHSEGYKGFQQNYSPRFAARVKYLYENPSPLRVLLAPLFCMGYFDAKKRRLIVTYILTTAIVALIIIFRQLPQPWRGILDAGVVVGLSWGFVATIHCCYRAFSDKTFNVDPEIGTRFNSANKAVIRTAPSE